IGPNHLADDFIIIIVVVIIVIVRAAATTATTTVVSMAMVSMAVVHLHGFVVIAGVLMAMSPCEGHRRDCQRRHREEQQREQRFEDVRHLEHRVFSPGLSPEPPRSGMPEP